MRFAPFRWSAAAFVTVLVAIAPAGSAQAACGGVYTASPAHHPRGRRPPLAIGDSTMLLALYDLTAIGYQANAHGCRQYPEALAVIRNMKAHGALPHMVVVALGADGAVTHDDVGETLGLLCCTRLLVLVTPRELGGGFGSDAITERQEARRHHGRILLLDWVKYSAGHGAWFQPDGLHLTTPGAHAFTKLLARALPYAYPAKHKRRRPTAAGDGAATAITMRASLARVGYVGLTLRGPSADPVQVSELVGVGRRRIDQVALGPRPTSLAHAARWLCQRRVRRLVADTLPPAAPASAAVTVRTPGCSGRLRAKISRVASGSRYAEVGLRDRWGIGGMRATVCLSPPGAAATCSRWWVHRGRSTRVVWLRVPRPGGWRVRVSTLFGYSKRATVWVRGHHGRILLLAAGDSEMQILDGMIATDLRPHGVDVTSDARISTGLTKPVFFDWEAHARAQAGSLRPDAAVMFIGANDGFPVSGPGGRQVSCCGAGWSSGYGGLVGRMLRSYLRGNRGRVYWFLLPAPRPANFHALFDAINAGIRRAAARFPGRVALIDANAFFTPGDRYRDFMTYRGHELVIHESDGIHLSAAADQVAARLLFRRMRADRLIR